MDYLEEIEGILARWQDDLEDRARATCQVHWDWITKERTDERNSRYWPAYSPQVRKWKGSVSINWLELKWIQRSGSEKKSMVSQYVRQTKRGYTKTCFPKASEYEKELIMELEERLAKIRSDLRLVGKIRGTIRMNRAARSTVEHRDGGWNK